MSFPEPTPWNGDTTREEDLRHSWTEEELKEDGESDSD